MIEQSQLEMYLHIWIDAQDGNKVSLESKNSSVYKSFGGTSTHFEDLLSKADSYAAQVIDVLVDGLQFAKRDAIRHQWLGELKCWPTHEMDLEDAYLDLRRLADKRGLV